jgi:hypothetical protein
MASDNFRYRYGENQPVEVTVATAQQVNIGDLVSQESNTLKRAEDETWTGTLSGTQVNFVASFMGVSGQRKNANATQPGTGGGPPGTVRVDTAGVFEFDCTSATFQVGDLVGPDAASNALLSQQVVAVSAKANAIGRVTESARDANGNPIAQTKVKVRIFTTKMGVINN